MCCREPYASFFVSTSGTAAAYISFQGDPGGARPVIQETTSDWQGINVVASYISINYFEVIGDAASVTLSRGAGASRLDAPATNDAGIVVGNYGGGVVYHHVIVSNNLVHDVDEDGIEDGQADYVTITGNVVYDNSKWSGYAGSGISVSPQDLDSSTGYKTYVTSNVVHDNEELVDNIGNTPLCGCISDGEGIIIDSAAAFDYGGRTLIANNVAYHNGSSGLMVFDSDHVDIVNNTTYDNGINLAREEINASEASDVNVYDDIAYAGAGEAASGAFTAEDYNDFDVVALKSPGAHDLNVDPQFVDPANANFELQGGSPCIGSGTTNLAPSVDIADNPRVSPITMGAYQSD